MKAVALLLDGSDIIDTDVLLKTDACFGKYDHKSKVCQSCNAPVVAHGRVVLFRDLCANGNTNPCNVVLTTQTELLERLHAHGPYVTWKYLLGAQTVQAAGKTARDRLSLCTTLARTQTKKHLIAQGMTDEDAAKQVRKRYPNIPTLKELIAWHSAQASG